MVSSKGWKQPKRHARMEYELLRNVREETECSESVLRSSRERWCCKKSKSSGCCEHASGVRTADMSGAGDMHCRRVHDSFSVRSQLVLGKPSCGDI